MERDNEFKRTAEMLKSIDPNLDYPNDTHSKAHVMRAIMGSVNVPNDESKMIAICACGWRGTMQNCDRVNYASPDESWARLAGRKGYHWNCPECKTTIWKYYYMIN